MPAGRLTSRSIPAELYEMTTSVTPGPSIGLTSILAGLSHALDLTEGHPRGHAERACRIAPALGAVIGLDACTSCSAGRNTA